METKYQIKNFRVFDEDGVEIEFAPLTILTGCNSSGKSSIVKSMILLDSFMKRIKQDYKNGNPINLANYKLNFSEYPNNMLGRYKSVLNNTSNSDKITLTYNIYSYLVGSKVTVELTFSPDANDILDNGYLTTLKVLLGDDIIYKSGKNIDSTANFNVIKDAFFDFIQIHSITEEYLRLGQLYDIENKISKNEYEEKVKDIKLMISGFSENRKSDVYGYMRFIDRKSFLDFSDLKNDTLNPLKEKNIIFYIPILEDISTLIKSEAIERLKDIISKEKDYNIYTFLLKVIDDFSNSEYETIIDYFYSWEFEYLNNVTCTTNSTCTPFMPKEYGFRIRQDYFLNNPNNVVDVVGDTNNDTKKDSEYETDEWLNSPLCFNNIYESLMHINYLSGKPEETPYYKYIEDPWLPGYYSHSLFEIMSKFIVECIREALLPRWSNAITFVSSTRVDIKRSYDIKNDSDFTRLLRAYFDYGRIYKNYLESHQGKCDYEPDSFMNKWVKAFGLGESLKLEMDNEGSGVKIRLMKEDGKSTLLADEGYGITQLMSILLQIECAIQSARKEEVTNYWNQSSLDGYDVSIFHYAEQTITIEEPEIHLHPKYQSLLADMFVEAVRKYNIHFVIETHSEYLIRKLQTLTISKEENNIDREYVSIYYIESSPITCARKIGICKNGYLDDEFGTGFFDETASLVRKLM